MSDPVSRTPQRLLPSFQLKLDRPLAQGRIMQRHVFCVNRVATTSRGAIGVSVLEYATTTTRADCPDFQWATFHRAARRTIELC